MDPLIKRAITIYVKAHFGWNNPDAERLQQSYNMLKCHLALSQEYTVEAVVMLFRDVIKLISTDTENDMGDIIETPVEREVFADKQSIRQSEFYQAALQGFGLN